MDAVLLQRWITLSGASSSVTVTQDVSAYLDIPGAIDVVLFVQTSASAVSSGVVRIEFQTSSARDEAMFRAVASPVTLDAGVPLSIAKATLKLATVPFARYLRWQVSSTGTGVWSATFRAFASFSVAPCDEVLREEPPPPSPDGAFQKDVINARAILSRAGAPATGRAAAQTWKRGE